MYRILHKYWPWQKVRERLFTFLDHWVMISSHNSTWPNYKMVIQKDKTIFVQNDAESGEAVFNFPSIATYGLAIFLIY